MATHPDAAHIAARQEKYRQAINRSSVDETMAFFAENVHFSDFSMPSSPQSRSIPKLLIIAKVPVNST